MKFKNNKKNGTKIVKYNKKKIIIISTIIAAIIAGTSVGIYYAVKPKPEKYPGNIKKVS